MARKLMFLIPVLLVTSILALPVQAFAKVEIKRIYYNPKGPDNRTNDSLNREWIQIHNGGTRAVRIWNWRIRDRSGRFFIFPNVSLTPGQDVRVGTGSGWDAFGDPILFYWGSSTYIWNNLGDTATLKRPDGRIVDRCTYPGGSPGHKFC